MDIGTQDTQSLHLSQHALTCIDISVDEKQNICASCLNFPFMGETSIFHFNEFPMTIDRRKFIQATGTLAFASFLDLLPLDIKSFVQFPDETWHLRIGTYVQSGSRHVLKGITVNEFTKETVVRDLNPETIDVFFHPYGSEFDIELYEPLMNYLKGGGCWLNLGGVPLSTPVRPDGHGNNIGNPQTGYCRHIGITQSYRVAAENIVRYVQASEGLEHDITIPVSNSEGMAIHAINELYLRLADKKYYPDEEGSDGPRNSVVRPLVLGLDKNDTPIAAPVIAIDHIDGPFKGGKWVFVTHDGGMDNESVLALVRYAAQGAEVLHVRPAFACYHAGEIPELTARLFHAPKSSSDQETRHCEIRITDSSGSNILQQNRLKILGGDISSIKIPINIAFKEKLKPGFYRVEATLLNNDRPSGAKATSGFWMFDRNLLESGPDLAVNDAYFIRDGKPFPVTGTTYMSSETHRQFLLEPTPAAWDRDFALMKKTGINMIRSGIWTGWKKYMGADGHIDEGCLRALDAFLLTACRYDIPVIFTFFAFLPETWGGENPFLDPRAVAMQKKFIGGIAARYRNVKNLLYDFINEPSFCSPKQLWSCRPNYDRYEAAAWRSWLEEKYPDVSNDERQAILGERYRLPADRALDLPPLEEFEEVNFIGQNAPLRTVDYRLFAQDAFAGWAKQMAAAVHAAGGTRQLATIGQDEGATADRPSPFFFFDAVDFTSMHNWWYNNDLVWDNVMTGVPGKPNLIEETGVMFYETLEGTPWRSEDDVAALLERKLAISLGAGGAGFLEWIWNTNPYMPSDNEAAIGLYRTDGTAKPELKPVSMFCKFFRENADRMKGRKAPDVAMVIPHANLFSPWNTADESSRKCIRALSFGHGLQVQGFSEYALNRLKVSQKLIIVPSPGVMSPKVCELLFRKVEEGAILAISGPFDLDEFHLPAGNMSQVELPVATRPVRAEEILLLDDNTSLRLTFGGNKVHRLRKTVDGDQNPPKIRIIPKGKGKIIWSPLPVENADAMDVIEKYYRFIVQQAILPPAIEATDKPSSVLILSVQFSNSILLTAASESDRDESINCIHRKSGKSYTIGLTAGRTALAFIDSTTGDLLASLGKIS